TTLHIVVQCCPLNPLFFNTNNSITLNRSLCDTAMRQWIVLTTNKHYCVCKSKSANYSVPVFLGTMCNPNPCQNGGTCIKGPSRRLSSFTCSCPSGYTGKFWPNDCYEDNGDSYRGMVSVTQDGDECLDWNSYFILQKYGDPFTDYAGFDGLGPHNFCRNPDGDSQPWCFIKKPSILCVTVPGDCYFRNGETYRGGVSVTVAGEDCLNWNDYFILARVGDPFMRFADFDGLGYNNHCRNPDGDIRPWCFIKKQGNSILNYYHVPFFSCCHSCPTVIYGGTKAFPGSNPWQASVQSRDRGSYLPYGHICGGILISSCWVLTAGHCMRVFYRAQGKQYQVVLGGINILEQEAMDQTIPVTDIYVHPDYREALFSIHNDIALLKLQVTDSPYCAKETPFVKIACLPDEAFPAGTECVISGWGATETQSYSSQLMDTNVFLISQEICKAPHIYASILDDSMFCAGVLQGGIDTCQGDSGGPLMCEKNGTHYVTGVVSWGDGCGKKNKPGVYANVLKFKEWIISKMN
uniref:trypsin n=1 Tax=Neogobius melanostomus TaxID=47308 RepID=A0A8C6SI88_9GOBI